MTQLPRGFTAAGANVGLKNRRPDCGVLLSERPANCAAVVSQNRARAANLDRIETLAGQRVAAIVGVSGSANALTEHQRADDGRLASALAEHLGVDEARVLTAFTGVLGHRPPVDRISGGLAGLLEAASPDPEPFARAILTTDRFTKVVWRDLFVDGVRVRVHAVAKGSGMISPAMATMLAFVTTDGEIAADEMQPVLRNVVGRTFNQLTVDGEMSTNDAVVMLANGAADVTLDAEVLERTLEEMFVELCEMIARDGEGATRSIEVAVLGAFDDDQANAIARAVAGSVLVKTAVFGADPNAGARIIAAAGGAAARHELALQLGRVALKIQGVAVADQGAMCTPQNMRGRMTEPKVSVELSLGIGEGRGRAWGCDLSYDYVKINADYAAITKATDDGSVGVEERLAALGPAIKKKVLIEALSYIARFRDYTTVVTAPAEHLEAFAEDVVLLAECGLRPVVVHDSTDELVKMIGEKAVGLTDRGRVDTNLLGMLETGGYIPVVSPRDESVVDLAQQIAVALGAEKLIFLVPAQGLMDGGELVSELTSDQAKHRLESDAVGGLETPIGAGLAALAGGAQVVHLIDGRVPHNLIAELFTDRGVGTLIRQI